MCQTPRMTTSIEVDPALLERAMCLSGEPTRRAVVTRALEEFVARREEARLLELFGSLDWEPGYDHKRERSRD